MFEARTQHVRSTDGTHSEHERDTLRINAPYTSFLKAEYYKSISKEVPDKATNTFSRGETSKKRTPNGHITFF